MSLFKAKQQADNPSKELVSENQAKAKAKENEKKTPLIRKSFEQTHKLEKLTLLLAVVNEGQDGAIVNIIYQGGGSVAFSCRGKGTASNDVYEVLGLSNTLKHVIIAPIPERSYPVIRQGLLERFAISSWAKGVAMTVDIDSIVGVSAYKFLTNTRGIETPKGEEKMASIEKKDGYEVIMAIVNDGFTDLVMDAAKRAGARGGTILTAHGTGNKDIEKFFGVVITPEKQIVMILVPQAIKDAVIEAIYKDVGIATKGQGIAFSFPCSDVIGIVEKRPDDNAVEEGTGTAGE